MKGSVHLFGTWQGRKAAARLVDGQLDDLIVDTPPGGPPPPGTVYLVRPDRPAKHQGGSFVALPGGTRGFLRHSGGGPPTRPIAVQVSSYAEPGKALPLTPKIALKGRFVLVTPDAPGINVSRQIRDPARAEILRRLGEERAQGWDGGLVLRSAAEAAGDEAIRSELDMLLNQARAIERASPADAPACLFPGPDSHALARRDWPEPDFTDSDAGAFDRHGATDLIEAMRRAEVPLPAGGSAVIEPTRALVAIDVNTGPDSSPAAGLKANLALVRALPRQLRCRGLGGQIVIDPAPMAKKDRRQIETALKAALRRDPVETALAGWTPLGHIELQRHRARPPLA